MPEYHSTWTAVQGIGRIHVHSEAQLVYLNIHFCCDSESVLQICHFISDSKKKVTYNVTQTLILPVWLLFTKLKRLQKHYQRESILPVCRLVVIYYDSSSSGSICSIVSMFILHKPISYWVQLTVIVYIFNTNSLSVIQIQIYQLRLNIVH